MSRTKRAPYVGDTRKLVVSIDVGTTFTAASFCILTPGEVPQFVELLSWPKQTTADAKVPSVIFYDDQGVSRAFGAETEDDATQLDAETNGWTKTEWFKLHLRPSHLPVIEGLDLPPLPPGKSVDDVFTDLLRFVKDQVQAYITARFAEGAQIWDVLSPSMDIVLTTPNGWELEQQQRMRASAQRAGWIPVDSGNRVRFVTEAEAAVLYAIDTGNISDWIEAGSQIILCDCGGGTIDITSYKIVSTTPLLLEETTAAKCLLAGSVFVNKACQEGLQVKLQDTEWSDEEAIKRALHHFDRNAKRKFESAMQTSLIDLGSYKSVPSLGIVRGKLKLSGTEMTAFFKRSLDEIQQGLQLVFEESGRAAKNVIMVGGLAGSAYIYSQLQQWAAVRGMKISRPDGPTTKAVANGALAWYLDGSVGTRVNKYHYGIEVAIPYDSRKPSMVGKDTYIDNSGVTRVKGVWDCIVLKDTKVDDGHEYLKPYSKEFKLNASEFCTNITIYCYRWQSPPQFLKEYDAAPVSTGFDALCTVSADLSELLQQSGLAKRSHLGELFNSVLFDVGITFGGTELAARIRWKEHGAYKYGPATIAYVPRPPQAT